MRVMRWSVLAASLLFTNLPANAAQAPSAPPSPAAPAPILVAADLRDGQDLSGPWHYSIDPFRSGIAGFHGEMPDKGQQRWLDVDTRAEMQRDSRVLYEFDLARSPIVSLPSPNASSPSSTSSRMVAPIMLVTCCAPPPDTFVTPRPCGTAGPHKSPPVDAGALWLRFDGPTMLG